MLVPDQTTALTMSEICELIITRFELQLNDYENRLRPLYLEGHSGIGKTQIVKTAAALLSKKLKLDVKCRILNLQFCERPDFMGLPHIDKQGNTSFARPVLLPKEGLGILFLDEANRVDNEIKSGMLTLLEDRNINGHELGMGWMIILAGNPVIPTTASTNYDVGEFDSALLDRIAHIKVEANMPELMQYLEAKYKGHILLEFLKRQESFINFNGYGCSPRTFEYALRATLKFQDINDKLFYKMLAVELGSLTALHIIKILSEGYLPTLNDVLSDDNRVYDYLSKNPDRIDVINNLIKEIFNYIKYNCDKSINISKENVHKIVNFLMCIQHEHRLCLFEMVRGSKYSKYFGNTFLTNTRLGEVLYAKRTATN